VVIAVLVCGFVFFQSSVKAGQPDLNIWDMNGQGVEDCIEADHAVDHLGGIFAISEAAKTRKQVEAGCLYLYSDEISSYKMIVKYVDHDPEISYGTWWRLSDFIYIKVMGSESPYNYQIKIR
jgi:hypothetical protein